MINVIWFGILFIGIAFGLLTGNGEVLSKTIVSTTSDTVRLVIELMDRINVHKDTASNDMVLFLVLNAACIQFIPTTVISIRAAFNSINPGAIIIPALCTTTFASILGIILCKFLQKYF